MFRRAFAPLSIAAGLLLAILPTAVSAAVPDHPSASPVLDPAVLVMIGTGFIGIAMIRTFNRTDGDLSA